MKIINKLSVLCLDVEGGHGGSSRSLFELVNFLNDVNIEVWCKRGGVIEDKYRDIGIVCKVNELMPVINSMPRLSRNIILLIRYICSFS